MKYEKFTLKTARTAKPKLKKSTESNENEFIGPLDEDQQNRLLEIAHKCPVHRTLYSEIVVKIRLKA